MLSIYQELIGKNGSNLKSVPECERSYELCLAAVRTSAEAVRFVPASLLTARFCLEAVKVNPRVYLHLPKEMRTEDFHLSMTAQDPLSIRMVAPKDRSAKVCDLAVAESPWALAFVPEAMRSKEQCERVLFGSFTGASGSERRRHPGRWGMLPFVPERYVDIALAYAVRQKNRHGMMFLPDRFVQTDYCSLQSRIDWYEIPRSLCGRIVEVNAGYIQLIPEFRRTKDLYRTLFLSHPYEFFRMNEAGSFGVSDAFRREMEEEIAIFVSAELSDEGRCLAMMRKNPGWYVYLPEGMRTVEHYNVFARALGLPEIGGDASEVWWLTNVNRWNYVFLPEELKTEHFYTHRLLTYRRGDWEAIYGSIPPTIDRARIHDCIVNHNPALLKYVPEDERTYELCLDAVKHSPLALEYVPEGVRDPRMLEAAVEGDGRCVRWIGLKDLTNGLCRKAVEHEYDKNGWPYLPKEMRSVDLERTWASKLPEKEGGREKVDGKAPAVRTLTAQQYLSFATDENELQYVPPEEKTEAFWARALARNPKVLRVMPAEVLTEGFVRKNFEEIVDGLETTETYESSYGRLPVREMLKVNGLFISYMDPADKDWEEYKREAVRTTGSALGILPVESRTFEVCLDAVRNDPYAVAYVPKELLEDQKFRDAVLSDPQTREFEDLDRFFEKGDGTDMRSEGEK